MGKTKPYTRKTPRWTMPVQEYVELTGKPSSEWTGKDLRKFLRWLWKTEPYGSGRYPMPERKWTQEKETRKRK